MDGVLCQRICLWTLSACLLSHTPPDPAQSHAWQLAATFWAADGNMSGLEQNFAGAVCEMEGTFQDMLASGSNEDDPEEEEDKDE